MRFNLAGEQGQRRLQFATTKMGALKRTKMLVQSPFFAREQMSPGGFLSR